MLNRHEVAVLADHLLDSHNRDARDPWSSPSDVRSDLATAITADVLGVSAHRVRETLERLPRSTVGGDQFHDVIDSGAGDALIDALLALQAANYSTTTAAA
jgi:hypothetical protein